MIASRTQRLSRKIFKHEKMQVLQQHTLFTIAVAVLIIPVVSSYKDNTCPKEVITKYGIDVTWPKIELDRNSIGQKSTISNPICLDNENQFVIRNCTTKGWNPKFPPDCILSQKNFYCPQEFDEIKISNDKYLCLKISKDKHPWMESSCYGSDKTIFDVNKYERQKILEFLYRRYNTTKFWLPAKRANNNGGAYNPFVWYLTGERWGDEISEKYYDNFRGDCAFASVNVINYEILTTTIITESVIYSSYSSTSGNGKSNFIDHFNMTFEIGDCNENLRSVCIFEKLLFIQSRCPKDYAALSYQPSICYGFNLEEKYQSRYDEIVPYVQYNYLNLIRDDNIFQRFMDFYDKNMEKDHKSNRHLKLLCQVGDQQHSIYDKNMNNDNWFIFNYKGQLQLGSLINCHLNLHYLEKTKSVQMLLNFNSKRNKLILTVYNYLDIWRSKYKDDDDETGIKCFTNADYEQIRTIKIKDVLFKQSDHILYEIKLYGDGPGLYWCQAHTIYNFELIETPKIIATKKHKGHAYAFFTNISCAQTQHENCIKIHQNMKHYGKRMEKILNELKQMKDVRKQFKSLIIHNVRIMKIESIIPNVQLRVLCHVTLSMKSSSVDNYDSSSEEDTLNDERFDKNGIRHDIWIRYKLKKLLIELLKTSSNYEKFSLTVNSTEYCFPESFQVSNNKNGIVNRWRSARIGETTSTIEMCLTRNGLPVMRKCLGDFMYGAQWEEINQDQKNYCIKNPKIENLITKDLYEIERSNLIEKEPKKVLRNIKEIIKSASTLISADFYYLSNIMNTIANKIVTTLTNQIVYSEADEIEKELNTTTTNTIMVGVDNNNVDDSNNSINNITMNISNGSLSSSSLLDVIKSSSGDIVNIYNSLMNVKINVIKPSIKLNSTNILLDAFETIIDETAATTTSTTEFFSNNNSSENYNHSSNYDDNNTNQFMMNSTNYFVDEVNGVNYYFSPKLLVFIIDPSVSNISGIALYKNHSNYESYNFENNQHKYLYSNQSMYDIIFENNLEVAAFAPQSLLEKLVDFNLSTENTSSPLFLESPLTQSSPKIVIKVYFNDHLFLEDRDVTDKKVFSKIISISIPGYDRELPEAFPIFMRTNSNNDENETSTNTITSENVNSCHYWNYSTWADDGLEYQTPFDNNIMLCGFSHLTPFAYLVGGTYNLSVSSDIVIITSIHQEALDIITLLGCSLSLIGIFGIFITAITFRSWREKPSSKVLLQLSGAIAFQMILFCFVNTEVLTSHLIENEIYSFCIVLGACLHYSVLVQFSWMLIIAFLQYKRYVQVIGNSRPTRFFVKTFALGWILPLVPIILMLIINKDAYIPFEDADNSKICYPGGQALYLAVVLPIGLIIVANLIIFILIIHNIIRGADGKVRQNERKLAVRQARLSILLFFLLGFTWIFGLLAAMKAGILFSYLFCLTATLQGFVLFIYFIILDPITRKMWSNTIQNYCSKEKDMK